MSENKKFREIADILGEKGMPETAEPIKDITEIEKDHLFNLLGSKNLKQFLGEAHEYSNDKDFLLKAVKINGLALEIADQSLRGEIELVEAAVTENGEALKFATMALQADKAMVTKAIEHSSFGYALEYADAILKKDKAIIELAALNNIDAIRFADPTLLEGKGFAQLLLKIDGNALRYLPEKFKNDEKMVLLAITHDPRAFKYAGQGIREKLLERLSKLPPLKVENSAAESGQDILKLDPRDQIKYFLDSTEVSSSAVAELGYWVDQLPKRLRNKKQGYSIDEEVRLIRAQAAYLKALVKKDDNRGKDIEQAKKNIAWLLKEISGLTEFDENWSANPELWTVSRNMNHG